jgi:nitrate/nitrite transport system substrate-binding protein
LLDWEAISKGLFGKFSYSFALFGEIVMKRRQLLHYGVLGSAGFAIAACNPASLPETSTPLKTNPFGKPEKNTLKISYVPSLDAAPLIIAQEKGLFERYGLNVTLKKQANWQNIEGDLINWQVDAAQAPYSLPLVAQYRSKPAAIAALMITNLNGGAIVLSDKAWQAGLRPGVEYTQFSELSRDYADYARDRAKPLQYAVESPTSMEALLLRYWLAAMTLDPDREIKLAIHNPNQLADKLQAGLIDGYAGSAPWNQKAIAANKGFAPYLSRDLWKGHPSKILATMQGWLDKHPQTAQALIAAVLEACQYCDRPQNQAEVVQILADTPYLNLDPALIAPSLSGNYPLSYQNRDRYTLDRPDVNVFHFKETNYLKVPDHANYPWQSHAVWTLTQLVRWQLVDLKTYPKNAAKQIAKLYPLAPYKKVAEVLGIELPKGTSKPESELLFVDRRGFDPAQPLAYLSQFTLRADRRPSLT